MSVEIGLEGTLSFVPVNDPHGASRLDPGTMSERGREEARAGASPVQGDRLCTEEKGGCTSYRNKQPKTLAQGKTSIVFGSIGRNGNA